MEEIDALFLDLRFVAIVFLIPHLGEQGLQFSLLLKDRGAGMAKGSQAFSNVDPLQFLKVQGHDIAHRLPKFVLTARNQQETPHNTAGVIKSRSRGILEGPDIFKDILLDIVH